jgi:hypothetical protein
LPTGYGGYIAGGGYSGSTKELDDTVQKAAKLLADAFGRDIEIRFNSHRESGGAWLKDDLSGFSGSCQVGLGAALRAKPPKGRTKEQWYDELSRKHGAWTRSMLDEIESAPRHVVVDTYIAGAIARDGEIVNSGNPDHRYASHDHKSLAEGLAFLKRHVNRSKLNPYTGGVLESVPLTGKIGKSSKRTGKKHTEGRVSGYRPSGLRAIGR